MVFRRAVRKLIQLSYFSIILAAAACIDLFHIHNGVAALIVDVARGVNRHLRAVRHGIHLGNRNLHAAIPSVQVKIIFALAGSGMNRISGKKKILVAVACGIKNSLSAFEPAPERIVPVAGGYRCGQVARVFRNKPVVAGLCPLRKVMLRQRMVPAGLILV